MAIPIIDIFAGPGGLGEGFSSIVKNNKRVFDIKLSIEKDKNAHSTLEFRSFFRQFPIGQVPPEYYDILKEENLSEREEKRKKAYKKYKKQAADAKKEAWCAELGNENFPAEYVDERIKNALKKGKGAEKEKNWLLIGGPPCQAYSMAGRSRVGGIDNEDHRVYLYKEYLRIIAKHHPAVFVMENVKGLLSAQVDGEKVFDWIKRDLQNPGSVFKDLDSPSYRVFSLSTLPERYDTDNRPIYEKDRDYLLKAENYGVPQKRHRVILLGIRADIKFNPDILKIIEETVSLQSVIGDLPKIRSGISKRLVDEKVQNGKKKRIYEKVENSDKNWKRLIRGYRKDIKSWRSFDTNKISNRIEFEPNGVGSEFVGCKTPSISNPRADWYRDSQGFEGACNHISRSHLTQDLKRYMFSSMFAKGNKRFPRLHEFEDHAPDLLPDHKSAKSGKFADRFRVQLENEPATTVTSHISKDGHYFIHYDPDQCRSLTVREAARIQTFPDNYLFCGNRTSQYHQVGNAVPPYLACQISEIVFEIFKEVK